MQCQILSVDRKIVVGSVMFGIGWELAGLYPGPAIASLSFGGFGGIVFLYHDAFGTKAARCAGLMKKA